MVSGGRFSQNAPKETHVELYDMTKLPESKVPLRVNSKFYKAKTPAQRTPLTPQALDLCVPESRSAFERKQQ